MDIVSSLKALPANCFTLFLILTSTVFAVAQFYDTRQRQIIDEGKKDVRGETITDAARPLYEEITNTEPLDNQIIIYLIGGLLLFYVFMLVVLLLDPIWPDLLRIPIPAIYNELLIISSVVLLVTCIGLLYSLARMRTQLNSFRDLVIAFKFTSEARIGANDDE